MDKKTRYIIICILSLLLGACLRCFSSKILYYNLKKEMIGYMDNIKNVRINLSDNTPLRNKNRLQKLYLSD